MPFHGITESHNNYSEPDPLPLSDFLTFKPRCLDSQLESRWSALDQLRDNANEPPDVFVLFM